MSRATKATNSSRSTAIITPIIRPAISPLEMALWEAMLTAGEDERVVRGEGGVLGGEGGVLGGEEGVVGGDDGVVGGASVVVVMVMTQSGAERLSSAVKHVGSMW